MRETHLRSEFEPSDGSHSLISSLPRSTLTRQHLPTIIELALSLVPEECEANGIRSGLPLGPVRLLLSAELSAGSVVIQFRWWIVVVVEGAA